jgi:predicted O-methyltransferase YrrM
MTADLHGLGRTAEREINWIIDNLPEYGTLIEVGTYDGVTAAIIARAKPNARIISIDPFPVHPESPGPDGAKCWVHNRCGIGQRLWVGTLTDLAELPLDPAFGADVIFIDGDHSYAGCLADLQAADALLLDGGIILCHDYQLRGEDCAGVEPAVVKFCQESYFGITGAEHTTVRLERGKGLKTGGPK